MRKAAQILKNSPLFIEELPDFSLKDVEDKIKKNIRDHEVKYVFHKEESKWQLKSKNSKEQKKRL